MFCSSDDFSFIFSSFLFKNIFSVNTPAEYQTVRIQIQIWVQTVCNGYEQTTLAGKELIKVLISFQIILWYKILLGLSWVNSAKGKNEKNINIYKMYRER